MGEPDVVWFRWRTDAGWWTKWHVQHPHWREYSRTLCGRSPARPRTAEDHEGTPDSVKACWGCQKSLEAGVADGG